MSSLSSSSWHLPFIGLCIGQGEGYYICKATQEMCIEYYYLGTLERS